MDSRKDQLQKQIIEAFKANDNDLLSLLKSQWAHRFGVESLEELKNLDLNQLNQNPTNEDNQEFDQSENPFPEDDQVVAINEDVNQVKEIRNDTQKTNKSVKVENKQSFEIKSYEIADKENYQSKSITPARENQRPPKVEALIPLPPKPKYGFLKKWLIRS